MSDQIFPVSETKVSLAPHIEAQANLRNAVAAVLWVTVLLLIAVSPAVVIAAWRVLL